MSYDEKDLTLFDKNILEFLNFIAILSKNFRYYSLHVDF